MVVPNIWRMVDKFCLEWHKRDGMTIHNSPCFKAEVQATDRKRKKTMNKQKKDTFEEIGRKAGKLKKGMMTLKKYVLAPVMEVLELFRKAGFFLTGTQIQCPSFE
jgi:ATP-dependent phosphoenolpyruvate carboxykinase